MPADCLSRHELEIKRRPAAPLAGFEQDSLTLDLDNCRVRRRGRDGPSSSIVIGAGFLRRAVIRPDDLGCGRLVDEGQPRPFPAAFVKRLGGAFSAKYW